MVDGILKIYRSAVLRVPWITIALVLAVVAVFAMALPGFKLEVAAEKLILENDPALRIYDGSRLIFGSDDYIILAYRTEDVFSDEDVAFLDGLTKDLEALDGVSQVMSLTTERLFRSPPVSGGIFALMTGEPMHLTDEGCDRELARKELTESRIYSENLVTPDATRTGMLVYLLQESKAHDLERRIHLLEWLLDHNGIKPLFCEGLHPLEAAKTDADPPLAYKVRAETQDEPEQWATFSDWVTSAEEIPERTVKREDLPFEAGEARMRRVQEILEAHRAALPEHRRQELAAALSNIKPVYDEIIERRRGRRATVLGQIREVVARHSETTPRNVHGAGVPVIFVDMMKYVKRDITVFGSAVCLFVLLTLTLVFRRLRWVVLPMTAGVFTVIIVVGAMVMCDVKTTVITSNLTSLLLILTMAHSIHFAIRFQEETALDPTATRKERVFRAVGHIGVPCFYIGTTTAVGFISLVISGIRPVIEFGQFMSLGVILAFLVTFLWVPAGLAVWPGRDKVGHKSDARGGPFEFLARFTDRHRYGVLAFGVVVVGVSVAGMLRLNVETVFTDYFHENTEIHRGLTFIDRELGGTSSLEIIYTADEDEYFTTWEHLAPLRDVTRFLQERSDAKPEAQREIGKILSVVTLMEELDDVLVSSGMDHPRGEDHHDARMLQGILSGMGTENFGPDRAAIFGYIDPTYRVARVFVRIRETADGLNRNRMVRDLDGFLKSQDLPEGVKAEVTGVFLLYANMLHSLISGQVNTSALVFGAVLLMMILLFRSVRLGLLALVPNVVPILMVLGLMGWMRVPLDMNNIMVASVSLGIAVDDTLHYLFRYKREIRRDGDYVGAMMRSHRTIGRALVWTSVVVVAGFLVLGFSNFVPTQHFGIFTTVAMVAALFAAMTLLPACLLVLKPFGRNPKTDPPALTQTAPEASPEQGGAGS